MQALGIKRGAVIHGHLGLDELSCTGINEVIYVFPNQLVKDSIDPKNFDIPYGSLEDYLGGDAIENANITKAILKGQKGPKQDIVALNAGLALFIAGISPFLKSGVEMAYKLLNEHDGYKQLQKITGDSNAYSQ